MVALARPRFIVAEVSKNWPDQSSAPDILAERFEVIVNSNWERGYRLVSFTHNQVMTGTDRMNETIIAVFELQGDSHAP